MLCDIINELKFELGEDGNIKDWTVTSTGSNSKWCLVNEGLFGKCFKLDFVFGETVKLIQNIKLSSSISKISYYAKKGLSSSATANCYLTGSYVVDGVTNTFTNNKTNILTTSWQKYETDLSGVIPSEAMMAGTIRTLKNETREMVKERMCAIVSGIAASFGAEAHVEFGSGCPVLYSHPEVYPRVKEILKSLDGVQVFDADAYGFDMSSMGSEDFAYVANVVPSVYLGLAAGTPEDGCAYPLHHPKAKYLDECLAAGTAAYAHVAMELLK